MKNLDEKILDLIKLNGGNFIFPEFYSHEDRICWKIRNNYTQYAEEKIVLYPINEVTFEEALDKAIEVITKKHKEFYG